MPLTRLTEQQRDEMHDTLITHTMCYSQSPTDTRDRERIIHAIDSAISQSETRPLTRVPVCLSDSHIEGCGRDTPHREALFRRLADIICPEDVAEWTAKRTRGDSDLQIYQDAFHMEFTWRSYALGMKFRFYTVSPHAQPGFARSITWSLLIVNWRLNEQAKINRELEAQEQAQYEMAVRESAMHTGMGRF